MNKRPDEMVSPHVTDSSQQIEANAAKESRRLRFDRVELAGAFGDLGTLLPIVVAMIFINKLSPSSVFLTFGLFYLVSGYYFRLPIPVQPLKAVGAIAIAYPAIITESVIGASGIIFSLFLLVFSLSGMIDQLAKLFSQAVVRGIQLTLGAGKSLALCGPSGSGKTTLVHALIHELDKNAYRSVLIPYAGHSRNGITRILAESLGVDTKGRGVPLIARTQQHIEAMIDGANPRHPVIVVDDAQRLENDSLWDLCSLLFQTAKPTAAASLLLVGDETLAKRLDLHILAPIRSRLTGIIKTQFMNENETRLFIEHRLKNADASPVLFDKDAVEIIAAFTRGNRRTLMNTATMALEEAYYLEEKTISASTFYNSEWFNESE